MDDLGDRPGAQVPTHTTLLENGSSTGRHRLQDRFVAADEQGELTLQGAFPAAVERRIQQVGLAPRWRAPTWRTTSGELVV